MRRARLAGDAQAADLAAFDVQAAGELAQLRENLAALGVTAEDVGARVADLETLLGEERVAIIRRYADAAAAEAAAAEQRRLAALQNFGTDIAVRMARLLPDQQAADLAVFDLQAAAQIAQARDSFAELGIAAEDGAAQIAQLETVLAAERAAIVQRYRAAEAEAARRAAEEALRAQEQAAAEARSTLMAAYSREAGELERVRSGMERLGRSLRDFLASIALDPNVSTLGPEQRLAQARAEFDAAVAAALGGDAEAGAQLPNVARAFLEASRAFNASGELYAADFAAVQAALTAAANTAGSQEAVARDQLALMERQLDALGLLNENLVTFAQALAGFRGAGRAAAAGGVGFATGGAFTVAGAAGNDNLWLPDLRVTAGEIVNVTRRDAAQANQALLTDIRDLLGGLLRVSAASGDLSAERLAEVRDGVQRLARRAALASAA